MTYEHSLQIGDQDRPFAVGVNQGDIYCQLQGVSMREYFEQLEKFDSLGFGARRDLLFSAIKAGYEQDGLRLDFNHMTVGRWMDAPDFDATAAFTPIIQAIGEQLQAKISYQKERDEKNTPAPTKGPKQKPAES